MVKSWNRTPSRKTTGKSAIPTAKVFSSKSECQANPAAMTGNIKAAHSAMMSPSVQPAPQWLQPLSTITGKAGLLDRPLSCSPCGTLRPHAVSSQPQDGAEQRGERPHQVHDPHLLRQAELIDDDHDGTESAEYKPCNRKTVEPARKSTVGHQPLSQSVVKASVPITTGNRIRLNPIANWWGECKATPYLRGFVRCPTESWIDSPQIAGLWHA